MSGLMRSYLSDTQGSVESGACIGTRGSDYYKFDILFYHLTVLFYQVDVNDWSNLLENNKAYNCFWNWKVWVCVLIYFGKSLVSCLLVSIYSFWSILFLCNVKLCDNKFQILVYEAKEFWVTPLARKSNKVRYQVILVALWQDYISLLPFRIWLNI